MNQLLQLNGRLEHAQRVPTFGPPELPAGGTVSVTHIQSLINDLETVVSFWKQQPDIGGCLFSASYTKVVAKSNRAKALLSKEGDPSNFIVGARYECFENHPAHTLSYFMKEETVLYTIMLLKDCILVLNSLTEDSVMTKELLRTLQKKDFNIITSFSKKKIMQGIVDCCYIHSFQIDDERFRLYEPKEMELVTIYDVGISIQDLLALYDLNFVARKGLDDNTVILNREEFKLLADKMPFLIAMAVTDINDIPPFIKQDSDSEMLSLPHPTNEPVVGVIDTLYRGPALYEGWIEEHDMTNPDIPLSETDLLHGAAVSGLIVNGPDYNAGLQDHCGYFRVRHFALATGGTYNSLGIARSIREIVSQNRDIKVWNLSLGSNKQVSENFISPEAAVLDQIQQEYDVIFVIAATNLTEQFPNEHRVGAPADSINSLVVGAVGFDSKPTSYTRRGPVLSFYQKPDICYYGGDQKRGINVCSELGMRISTGTSLAAPLITRKVAYLIYKMGLSREVAKALIIDSAVKWNKGATSDDYLGYGIVPVKIEDILQSKDDEIKFFINGISNTYETYNFNIPVPMEKDKYPFKAKATLCYFPESSRNQGVDYTNTELDFHFGRISDQYKIKSINGNCQNEETPITESNARNRYRKWDNVKCICETVSGKSKPVKSYSGSKNWGFSIKKTTRLNDKNETVKFGMVITLKEINGVNRIESFIKQCYVNNWMVIPVSIDQRVDVFNKAEEEVVFE